MNTRVDYRNDYSVFPGIVKINTEKSNSFIYIIIYRCDKERVDTYLQQWEMNTYTSFKI